MNVIISHIDVYMQHKTTKYYFVLAVLILSVNLSVNTIKD